MQVWFSERELLCGFEPIGDGINHLHIIIIIIIIITLSVLLPSGREVPHTLMWQCVWLNLRNVVNSLFLE